MGKAFLGPMDVGADSAWAETWLFRNWLLPDRSYRFNFAPPAMAFNRFCRPLSFRWE
jgi:hypothetical protein